jgi:broad specificity phosphatase PhoE
METRILLIRHGASHHREDGVVAGRLGCRGLTAVGRRQAENLAERLARELPERPDAIYRSIPRRAVETAEILEAARGGIKVVEDCALCTWHTPASADGLPVREFQRAHVLPGGVYRPFEEGNEPWGEMVVRVGRALE